MLSRLKLLYYKCFALIYGFAGGRFSDLTMVNSSWTEGHIRYRHQPIHCLLMTKFFETEMEVKYVNFRQGVTEIISLDLT